MAHNTPASHSQSFNRRRGWGISNIHCHPIRTFGQFQISDLFLCFDSYEQNIIVNVMGCVLQLVHVWDLTPYSPGYCCGGQTIITRCHPSPCQAQLRGARPNVIKLLVNQWVKLSDFIKILILIPTHNQICVSQTFGRDLCRCHVLKQSGKQ